MRLKTTQVESHLSFTELFLAVAIQKIVPNSQICINLRWDLSMKIINAIQQHWFSITSGGFIQDYPKGYFTLFEGFQSWWRIKKSSIIIIIIIIHIPFYVRIPISIYLRSKHETFSGARYPHFGFISLAYLVRNLSCHPEKGRQGPCVKTPKSRVDLYSRSFDWNHELCLVVPAIAILPILNIDAPFSPAVTLCCSLPNSVCNGSRGRCLLEASRDLTQDPEFIEIQVIGKLGGTLRLKGDIIYLINIHVI